MSWSGWCHTPPRLRIVGWSFLPFSTWKGELENAKRESLRPIFQLSTKHDRKYQCLCVWKVISDNTSWVRLHLFLISFIKMSSWKHDFTSQIRHILQSCQFTISDQKYFTTPSNWSTNCKFVTQDLYALREENTNHIQPPRNPRIGRTTSWYVNNQRR